MRKNFPLSCILAASTFLTAGTAHADFTIGTGQTETTPQVLTDNESGIVELGATLDTPGDAILGNDGNTITNAGTVVGVDRGIAANSGNTITNTGTVTGGDIGIVGFFNSTILNSGTVNATNAGATGIGVNNDGVVINSGTVTSAEDGIGLGGSNILNNSGVINGGVVGVLSNNNNTITNSGTIIGGTHAVEFENSDSNTLILLAGSALQGNLALGGFVDPLPNPTNTLIIGPGLNTALGFTGDPTIQADGLPFVVVNDTVYVVDVTGFSMHDEMVGDLTRSVGRSLEDRLSATRQGDDSGALSAMALGYAPITLATASFAETWSSGFWASGLGGYRTQDGGTTTLDFETRFAGAMAGYDTMVTPETRVGVFGGISFADVDTGVVGQELSTSSFFGGLYLGHEMGRYTLDASLTAGWSDFDSERRVTNNLIVGGIETARASYGGAFISPSLTLGTDFSVGSGTLTPSMRVRYAGLFLDSYTETGSAANLTVGDRAIHIFEAGAELTYALAARNIGVGVFQQSFSVGVDGTLVEGDAVSASVVGQALSFDAETEDAVRGFLGYDVALAMTERTSLSVSAEAGYDSNGARTVEGRAGFSLAF